MIYIALLRGINVGRHKRIKMAELKRVFEEIGLKNVQTYIQSGNVIFNSMEDSETIRRKIEHEIEETFGFSVDVVLRTSSELVKIIENCPYLEEASQDGKSVHVAMMLEDPSQEGIDRISNYQDVSDVFQIDGMEVYLLFRQGMRNSKLADNFQKLGVSATMRNWNTLTKLAAIIKTIET